MINSFLNKLLCTRCNKKIYINNVVYKKKRLINGTLICKNCKIQGKMHIKISKCSTLTLSIAIYSS